MSVIPTVTIEPESPVYHRRVLQRQDLDIWLQQLRCQGISGPKSEQAVIRALHFDDFISFPESASLIGTETEDTLTLPPPPQFGSSEDERSNFKRLQRNLIQAAYDYHNLTVLWSTPENANLNGRSRYLHRLSIEILTGLRHSSTGTDNFLIQLDLSYQASLLRVHFHPTDGPLSFTKAFRLTINANLACRGTCLRDLFHVGRNGQFTNTMDDNERRLSKMIERLTS